MGAVYKVRHLLLDQPFVIKVIRLSTRYSPSVFGFNALDFVVIAGICFAFALTLVARTWLKLNEPKLAVVRRDAAAAEARLRAAEIDLGVLQGGQGRLLEDPPLAETANADRR